MSRIKGGRNRDGRKSDRCGKGGPGTPSAHLEARQESFDRMASGGRGIRGGLSFNPLAFKRPGSNKK